jgi:hypothetical protein
MVSIPREDDQHRVSAALEELGCASYVTVFEEQQSPAWIVRVSCGTRNIERRLPIELQLEDDLRLFKIAVADLIRHAQA